MNKNVVISLIFIFLLSCGLVYSQDIPDEARRHFQRGVAAANEATSKLDYEEAIKEFKKAKQFAPNWPDVYYNMGLVYEKLGRYREAINNLEVYLRLSPQADDIQAVQDKIYELEYKLEKTAKQENFLENLHGVWKGGGHYAYSEIHFYVTEGKIEAGVYTRVYGDIVGSGSEYRDQYKRVPVERKGNTLRFKYGLVIRYKDKRLDSHSLHKPIPLFFQLTMTTPDTLSGSLVWGDNPPHTVTYRKYSDTIPQISSSTTERRRRRR